MFGYSTEHGVTQKPPTALPIRMAVIKRILIRSRGWREKGVGKIGFPSCAFLFHSLFHSVEY